MSCVYIYIMYSKQQYRYFFVIFNGFVFLLIDCVTVANLGIFNAIQKEIGYWSFVSKLFTENSFSHFLFSVSSEQHNLKEFRALLKDAVDEIDSPRYLIGLIIKSYNVCYRNSTITIAAKKAFLHIYL